MPVRSSLFLMASMVREREISPVHLVEAHLRQIDRMDCDLRAFVRVYADEALATARRIEEQAAHGEALGLLAGVPVTVKDSFDLAGSATVCGSRTRLAHRASRDSTPVARLKAAGAVILGKTNTPELLYHYETENYTTGRTVNPWDRTKTAGGSSGGEAAAIASLCSAGGIGSDAGGSIRVPAHCCGIAGLKPTPGRVPAPGHFPAVGYPGGLLGVAGPMARSARDLSLLFAVLTGDDDQDPFSVPVPLRPPDTTDLRIGVMEQFPGVPAQPEVRAAVVRAAETAESLGFGVEPFDASCIAHAPSVWWFFFGRLGAPGLRPLIEAHSQDIHPMGRELYDRATQQPDPTALDVVEQFAARDRMRAALLRRMRSTRVLLLPVCSVTAWTPGQRQWSLAERSVEFLEAMSPSSVFNLLGLPGATIPFGNDSNGLPVGIQLVGRPYDEELLLALAERLEEARGPYPAPPSGLV